MLEEVLAHEELITEWRTRLETAALPVVALGGYRNLVAPDATNRRANIGFLQRCLELASHFGTALVATETGTRNRESEWAPSPENQGKEAWETLCPRKEQVVAAFLQRFKDRFVLAHLKDVSSDLV